MAVYAVVVGWRGGLVLVFAGLAVGFLACTQSTRTESAVKVASDAGGDVVRDASGPSDAPFESTDAQVGDGGVDAGPHRTRIWVPFPDCTGNDPGGHGAGPLIEGCDCDMIDQTECCSGGGALACTGLGWRSFEDACSARDTTVACELCERGAAGCSCLPDRSCVAGAICLEGLCGTPMQ